MKQATTKHNVSEIFLMQNDIGSLYMQFVLLSIIFYRAFLVSKIRKSVSMKKLYFLFIFFTTVPRHDTSIARWKKSRCATKSSGSLTPSESFSSHTWSPPSVRTKFFDSHVTSMKHWTSQISTVFALGVLITWFRRALFTTSFSNSFVTHGTI